MNKRLIIIISSVTIVIILILVGIFSIFNQSSDKTISDNNGDISGNIKDSSLTKDNYYVEKGFEDLAKIAKPAAESFANQDITESAGSRNDRLGKYFTSDSLVYGYAQENIGPRINKSTAKVTSVVSCEEQEGGDWCLMIMVDLKLYSGNNIESSTTTYWMTLVKIADDSYKPDDIGVWE